MPKPLRIIMIALLLGVFSVGYMGVSYYRSNGIDRKLSQKDPFAIRLILKDKDDKGNTYNSVVAQSLILPDKKQILLFFVNSDAAYQLGDKLIRNASESAADQFSSYTGVNSSYYLTVDRESATRLLNLAGGVRFFLEEPLVFANSQFQYPQGLQKFSGEQLMEYALIESKPEIGQENFAGIEKLYRSESALLNIIWQSELLYDAVNIKALWEKSASLVDTNLSADELASLVQFLIEDETNLTIAELPLDELTVGGRKQLVVKESRAKSIYSDFLDNVKSNALRSDNFSLIILNGTEKKGLARRVKQFLQGRSILVLEASNYPYKPVKESIILNRTGNIYNGKKLFHILGLDRKNIYFARKLIDVDNTLILGDDFETKKMQF